MGKEQAMKATELSLTRELRVRPGGQKSLKEKGAPLAWSRTGRRGQGTAPANPTLPRPPLLCLFHLTHFFFLVSSLGH